MSDSNPNLFVQFIMPGGAAIVGIVSWRDYDNALHHGFEHGLTVRDPTRLDSTEQGSDGQVGLVARPVFLTPAKQRSIWFNRPNAIDIVGTLVERDGNEPILKDIEDAGGNNLFKMYRRNLESRRTHVSASQSGIILPK